MIGDTGGRIAGLGSSRHSARVLFVVQRCVCGTCRNRAAALGRCGMRLQYDPDWRRRAVTPSDHDTGIDGSTALFP